MKVKRETINGLIESMKEKGKNNQEIENEFKTALKQQYIDIDDWYNVTKKLYGETE